MSKTTIKISMAQYNSVLGSITANREKVLLEVEKSVKKGSNILIFPEMFFSGYQPLDLVKKRSFLENVHTNLRELAIDIKETGLNVFLGVPLINKGKVFNSYVSLVNGLVKIGSQKVHLPNYDVFDEQRYFSSSNDINVFKLDNITLGFPICEDAWFPDVISKMKKKGAELIVVTNGSPYETGKLEERQRLIEKRCSEVELPIIYLNLVGGQDDIVFDGGSFVYNKEGKKIEQFPQFKECSKQIVIKKSNAGWDPLPGSLVKVQSQLSQDYHAIVLGLRDYVIKSNFKRVVLGLSGGIDSALVSVLAVDALGSENVLCVALPSKFNAKASLDDAKALAHNLKVKLEVLNINALVGKSEQILSSIFLDKERDVTEENIQSRLRAVLLMAISNKMGYLLLSTGNKSEIAVGYSTIYGDMAGGVNPLKDVYKTKVFQLSHWRNKNRIDSNDQSLLPVIPNNIINKEPSAELAFDQKDSDSLPEYEELDSILECLIEMDLSVKEVVRKGFAEDTVLKVEKLIYASEYKRYQSAPGTKISRKPFALGRRYPLVNQWRDRV